MSLTYDFVGRNGRFLLQSSHNKLATASLTECEEALNQGSMNAADVFVRLRSRSILHLFASISRFLGLEVWFMSYILCKEGNDVIHCDCYSLFILIFISSTGFI